MENLKSVKNVAWQRASSSYNKHWASEEKNKKQNLDIISNAAQEVNPD